MKTISALMAAAMVASVSINAQAAIDLRVKGTIVPASCVPFLQGGGVVDYGNIAAEDLNQTSYTVLEKKEIVFNINCRSHTKVGLKAQDGKGFSQVPGILAATIGADYTDNYNYGLGATADGENIGGYAVNLKPGSFNASGTPVKVITSLDKGTSWIETATGAVGQNDNLGSWARTVGLIVPVSFVTLSGVMEVQAVINKASELTINNDVPLDGLATFELSYL
jgi:type 1 fimbria pilin